jgi:sucrose-phosphate synthase
LIATDLDGTFVGDPEATIRLTDKIKQEQDRCSIAFVTGRHKELTFELINEQKLLLPDYLIASVGTEIYVAPDYDLDPDWRKELQPNWNRDEVEQLLSDIPELTPQALQFEFKQSYYLTENAQDVIGEMERRLAGAGISHKIIYSSDRDLDVLAGKGGKGSVLRFLQRKLGLREDQILVCGDSGNDLEMLVEGFLGVAVGNAKRELKEATLPPTVYRARAECADGIIEAIEHFDFFSRERVNS